MGMGSQLQQGGIGNLGAIRPRVRPDPRPHGNVGMGPNDYMVPSLGPRPSFGPGPRPFPNRPPYFRKPPFYTNRPGRNGYDIPDLNGYDRFGPPFLTGIPRGEDGSIYGKRRGKRRDDVITLAPEYEPPVVVDDTGFGPVDPNLIGQPAPPVGDLPPLFLAEGGETNPAGGWWSGPAPMSDDDPLAADLKGRMANMPPLETRAIRADFSDFPRFGGSKGGKGGVPTSTRMVPFYKTGNPLQRFESVQGRPGMGPRQMQRRFDNHMRMMGGNTGQVAEPQQATADIIRRRMYGGI